MGLGPHATFILAAYGTTAVVVALLVVWVVLDRRMQLRMLLELEASVPRRSARHSTGQR
ncbi:MAG TPA: heme exporter protein CcmD [Xanthobacteraceae bacterium]|jgi:heme exporter protein D